MQQARADPASTRSAFTRCSQEGTLPQRHRRCEQCAVTAARHPTLAPTAGRAQQPQRRGAPGRRATIAQPLRHGTSKHARVRTWTCQSSKQHSCNRARRLGNACSGCGVTPAACFAFRFCARSRARVTRPHTRGSTGPNSHMARAPQLVACHAAWRLGTVRASRRSHVIGMDTSQRLRAGCSGDVSCRHPRARHTLLAHVRPPQRSTPRVCDTFFPNPHCIARNTKCVSVHPPGILAPLGRRVMPAPPPALRHMQTPAQLPRTSLGLRVQHAPSDVGCAARTSMQCCQPRCRRAGPRPAGATAEGGPVATLRDAAAAQPRAGEVPTLAGRQRRVTQPGMLLASP
jgi:hypothetical protein